MTRLYEPFAYTDGPRADCAWEAAPDWPTLDGDQTTDIAIIGGGYTGLSAALHLAEDGQAVTVLDANYPGWGASGRNGGFCCLGGAKMSDTSLARRYGRTEADLWHNTEHAAISLVAGLLYKHGIDADTHSDGEVEMAHNARAFAGFAASRDAYLARGIDAKLIPTDALADHGLNAAGMHGALHVRAGFALNPGKYAIGLARAAQKAGADIRARSEVTGIERDGDGFRLTTPTGTLRAKRLIVATNGYSREDAPGWLAGRTMPVQSTVIVTRPISEAERRAQGWTSDLMAFDSKDLLHYFRLMPDGRFLFGMRGGVRATARARAITNTRIRRDFAAMFPAWAGVETQHTWSGLVNLARNLTPFVGPIPDMPNAWTGMAYHGNGVAMASYSGVVLADLAQGRSPRVAYPRVMQKPLGRFPFGRRRRVLLDLAYPMMVLKDRL